jgi:hypothetical protein
MIVYQFFLISFNATTATIPTVTRTSRYHLHDTTNPNRTTNILRSQSYSVRYLLKKFFITREGKPSALKGPNFMCIRQVPLYHNLKVKNGIWPIMCTPPCGELYRHWPRIEVGGKLSRHLVDELAHLHVECYTGIWRTNEPPPYGELGL